MGRPRDTRLDRCSFWVRNPSLLGKNRVYESRLLSALDFTGHPKHCYSECDDEDGKDTAVFYHLPVDWFLEYSRNHRSHPKQGKNDQSEEEHNGPSILSNKIHVSPLSHQVAIPMVANCHSMLVLP